MDLSKIEAAITPRTKALVVVRMTAAFGRAQLAKLHGYLRTESESTAILLGEWKGVRGLILPIEPEGHAHTYFNFTCRVDPSALGWNGSSRRFLDAVLLARQRSPPDRLLARASIRTRIRGTRGQELLRRGTEAKLKEIL